MENRQISQQLPTYASAYSKNTKANKTKAEAAAEAGAEAGGTRRRRELHCMNFWCEPAHVLVCVSVCVCVEYNFAVLLY